MLIALNENKNKILGQDADKKKNYYCPECQEIVILKKGRIKIHHYAHKTSGCVFGRGESLEHLEYKFKLFKLLKSIQSNEDIVLDSPTINSHGNEFIIANIILEYKLGNRIADICCEGTFLNGSGGDYLGLALEIQLSKISLDELLDRTIEYKGNVIWFFGPKYYQFEERGKGYFIKISDTLERFLDWFCVLARIGFYEANKFYIIHENNIYLIQLTKPIWGRRKHLFFYKKKKILSFNNNCLNNISLNLHPGSMWY